jgi:hypothetical protein
MFCAAPGRVDRRTVASKAVDKRRVIKLLL